MKPRLSRAGLVIVASFLLAACGTSQQPKEDLGSSMDNNLLVPPLSQVFPLDPKPDGMRVKYPVLLNETTVLGPNAVLRFIYNKSSASEQYHGPLKSAHDSDSIAGTEDEAQQGGHHHHGGLQNQGGSGTQESGSNSSSQLGSNGDSTAGSDASSAKGKGHGGAYGDLEVKNTVWVDRFLYVEALENAVEGSTCIVYSLPPDSSPLVARIHFPGGILLAEVQGHIEVLGLSESSPAYLSGVRPGDEITSLDHQALVSTLNDFVRIYGAAEQRAKISRETSVSADFKAAKGSKTISVGIDF